MINFYVPNFWQLYNLNTTLVEYMRGHPEKFYDDINIASIYGNFPSCIWNGGRTMVGPRAEPENVKATIEGLNELGIAARFTFTNCLLEEKHLSDEYCNMIMQAASNGMNEVVINSPILEKYLREEYPNFKYISSTTKCLSNEQDIFDEAEKYYLTVLDYRKNIDIPFLQKIRDSGKSDKYELLINAYCSPNCNKRDIHYIYLSRLQLQEFKGVPHFCDNTLDTFYQVLEAYPTVLKVPDLYEIYNKEFGFRHFKIEGRTANFFDVLESYIYYMVKPEWKDKVRLDLCKEVIYLF